MGRVIIISTSGDVVTALKVLDGVKRKLPQFTREGMQKWGKMLERDVKAAAINAGVSPFTGILYGSGIRYEQGHRSDIGFLFIRQYGVFLDSMKPHFVSIHRRRTRLLAWAKQARSSAIRNRARLVEMRKLKSFSIYVRPHPFIRQGYNKAIPKLNAVLGIQANKALRAA